MRIRKNKYKDRNPAIVVISQLTIISSLLLIGCEKEVKLNLPSHESEMVVEGWIEQGKTPHILLTLTVPYFNKIDSINLRNYAVTVAKVSVKCENDSMSEILTFKPNDVYFPPYVYFGTEMYGETGNTYQLSIVYKNKNITAITTIPALVKTDSVWFQHQNGSDSLGIIGFRLKDDPEVHNYYRTLTKRLGKDKRYIPTYTSVFDDKTFNGETLKPDTFQGQQQYFGCGE